MEWPCKGSPAEALLGARQPVYDSAGVRAEVQRNGPARARQRVPAKALLGACLPAQAVALEDRAVPAAAPLPAPIYIELAREAKSLALQDDYLTKAIAMLGTLPMLQTPT